MATTLSNRSPASAILMAIKETTSKNKEIKNFLNITNLYKNPG
jgi:hypothetical protein